ncbi:MAG: long-chain acyl-CoA synthetase [Actinomycetota bacterium]|nr:long-chain acyl-CoA synthetase [Actinomycetota bacterium]
MTQNISGDLAAKLPQSAPTLSHSILNRVAETPDAPAFGSPQSDGEWRIRTWKEAGSEMVRLAAGLLALGL